MKDGLLITERDLSKERSYVDENKEKLLKEYPDKFLLIHEKEVVGSFDSYQHAAEEGIRLFGISDKFLVCQMTSQKPLNFIMEAAL